MDLGILYLARALPIDPAQLDRTAASDRVGQIGKIVGFGVDESGNSGRKKSTTMRVAESFRNQFLLKSSDGNLRSSCNGDSGGPLFIGEGASRVLQLAYPHGDQEAAKSMTASTYQ